MIRTQQPFRQRYYALAVGLTAWIVSLIALLPYQVSGQGVRGEVLDGEAGRPVSTAKVELINASGSVVGRALSDSAGRFLIEVDLGTYSLLVNRLGYEPLYVTDIQVTSTSLRAFRVLLSPDAVQLPGLVVQGEESHVRFLEVNGFYDRKGAGFGNFVEVGDLQRLQTITPTELLRRLPGIKIQGGEVRSSRAKWINQTMQPCLLQLVVDGIYRGINLDDVLIVEEIDAIEVYNGLSNVPPQWKSLGERGYLTSNPDDPLLPTCGVILVWTKH